MDMLFGAKKEPVASMVSTDSIYARSDMNATPCAGGVQESRDAETMNDDAIQQVDN